MGKQNQEVPTLDQIRAWPHLVSLAQAATALDLSKSGAAKLAKAGKFPTDLVQIGGRQKVRRDDILRLITGTGEASA